MQTDTSNIDDESATVHYEYFKMTATLSLMKCAGSVWRKRRKMKKKRRGKKKRNPYYCQVGK